MPLTSHNNQYATRSLSKYVYLNRMKKTKESTDWKIIGSMIEKKIKPH